MKPSNPKELPLILDQDAEVDGVIYLATQAREQYPGLAEQLVERLAGVVMANREFGTIEKPNVPLTDEETEMIYDTAYRYLYEDRKSLSQLTPLRGQKVLEIASRAEQYYL